MLYTDFMKNRTDCPFCSDREEEILRRNNAYLTYSLAPYTKHHLMVVPNRHVESINELTKEEVEEIHELECVALNALRKLGHENATFLMREGASSHKSVPHLHYHVIPKVAISTVESDSRNREIMTAEEIKETVADIKKYL